MKSHTLFKYMAPRHNFFQNYLLRASNKFCLNDPFEVCPSVKFFSNLIFNMKPKSLRLGSSEEEIASNISKSDEWSTWSDGGFDDFRENGFISLSETNDNLLMWAHYAKDHTGCVVEFDVTNRFFNDTYTSGDQLIGKINRVLYRKERLLKHESNILEAYFYKSDEWSYEKEHRLLIPLHKFDHILCDKSYGEKLTDGVYVADSDIQVFGDKLDGLLEIKKDYSNFYSCKEIMYMFKVPPLSIRSITFGCRCDESFIAEVKKSIFTQGLSDIALFQAKKDNMDYRLRIETLN
jgi:hypothetical protein